MIDCEAVGSGTSVLNYLARDVFRTAMSGRRELVFRLRATQPSGLNQAGFSFRGDEE